MARRTRRSRQEWQGLISEWESSGLGQREFAKHRGLNEASMARWARQIRRDSAESTDLVAARFVEVVSQKSAGPTVGSAGVVLRLGRGLSLELPEWPTPEYLALVARSYERVSPC